MMPACLYGCPADRGTTSPNNNLMTFDQTACKHCGTLFTPTHTVQRFCTHACRKAATYARMASPILTRRCVVCFEEFHSNNSVKICCSPACARERRLQNQAIQPWRRKGAIVNCKKCGTSFKKSHHNEKYCSPDCANRDAVELMQKKCLVCGNDFMPTRHNSLVCGDECRAIREVRYEMRKKALEKQMLQSAFCEE